VPPPSTIQLGAAIRRIRQENGLSIEALADQAGLSWVYLGEIENGKRNPSWTVVGQIADGLGIEIADLATLAKRTSG
jgi:transcriptional regulator with XRE-family HTH domain